MDHSHLIRIGGLSFDIEKTSDMATWAEFMSDIPNFTDIQPQVQISEIL
jgi:hypothetical protein